MAQTALSGTQRRAFDFRGTTPADGQPVGPESGSPSAAVGTRDQQVGHWQTGVVLAGAVHAYEPVQTPRHPQVGAPEQADGTVTQW